MGQRHSSQQQTQQHPTAQRAVRCEASAAEAPSAAPGSTAQIGSSSGRKLTYVSYEANSWQATFEQTGAIGFCTRKHPLSHACAVDAILNPRVLQQSLICECGLHCCTSPRLCRDGARSDMQYLCHAVAHHQSTIGRDLCSPATADVDQGSKVSCGA